NWGCEMSTRRQFIAGTSLLAGAMLWGSKPRGAFAAEGATLRTRVIPASGETVPAIGMGTSGSFEVQTGSPQYRDLKEVLKRFFDAGATVIDTAPTYSNAEDNLGALLAELGLRKRAFIATKLSGVTGREEGLEQFN